MASVNLLFNNSLSKNTLIDPISRQNLLNYTYTVQKLKLIQQEFRLIYIGIIYNTVSIF